MTTPLSFGDAPRREQVYLVAAGAVALGVGSTLITGPNQTMADLITRARGLKKAWES